MSKCASAPALSILRFCQLFSVIDMVQHFVTVCVVCVLCAAHTPCSAHTDLSRPQHLRLKESLVEQLGPIPSDIKELSSGGRLARSAEVEHTHAPDDDDTDDVRNANYHELMKRLGHAEQHQETSNETPRLRRHADEHEQTFFIKQLFNDFGDGQHMTIDGFEKLLNKLGLVSLVTDPHKHSSKTSNIREVDSTSEHEKNSTAINKSKDSKKKCLNSNELLSTLSEDDAYKTRNATTMPIWLFERVCPALIYHLASDTNRDEDCLQIPNNYSHLHLEDLTSNEMDNNSLQVWVYSSISILVISICGLFGVAVIPIMGKSYYNSLLQFLVALAVGTLCGDALIHLLPHAMMSHSEHDHSHETLDHETVHNLNMWKGFTAMMGVVLFFFTEKALNMIAEWRKHRQRRSKLPARVKVMREPELSNSNASVGEKLCKHKYSSYPYCYGEIATENQDNHQHNHKPAEEEKPLTSHCNSVQIMDREIEKKEVDDWKLDEPMKKSADNAEIPMNENESYTVILREHENRHHGHTHSHGHVHSAPESMSSVAWMVIMGDGLHNFTDGMAIGAAFSAGIAGGFSTAIAVFCHELPHELGDFAVLLKAGMSAKQAVFYNLLSSVLCLFGMIFGVLLGGTPAMSSWIFSGAAGMFIYIALVDMMPELSSNHSDKAPYWQGILQGLGLITGIGIMLIIALYEHDLKHIFGD